MWNATRWACFLALLGTTMLTDAGHRHRRMSCSAPACSGPSCFEPSCFGPGCYGPSCFGPSCFGPACSSPVCSAPACSGPACFAPASCFHPVRHHGHFRHCGAPSCFQPVCSAPSCAASCFGGCAAPVDWSTGYAGGYASEMAWRAGGGADVAFDSSYGWTAPAQAYQVPAGPMLPQQDLGWSTAATYHAPMPPMMRPAPPAPASDLVW